MAPRGSGHALTAALRLLLAACLLLSSVPVPDLRAASSVPVPELPALPPPGGIVDMKELGITAGPDERPPAPIPGGLNFRYPADFDRDAVIRPGLHLNVPLHVVPRDVNYLFLSDQPEEMRDNRAREDGSTGATGLYAKAPLPAQAPTRVMVDHTDGTKRPLRYWLLWVPRADGVVVVRKRGEHMSADSVLAGRVAFERALGTPVEPRAAVRAGVPFPLLRIRMVPAQTAVAQIEFVSTVPGVLYSVATEADAPMPADGAALDGLPVLHSIVWREEAKRLEKFVNPKLLPRRFQRIMQAFQHARGHFHYPDRMGYVTWTGAPHAYSLFESIPGRDVTVPAPTDNRGKYGAKVGLRIKIGRLPRGFKRVALVLLNPNATWGGRHLVTDGKRAAFETLHLPGRTPGLIQNGKAATLWIGEARRGDVLTMTTEPMANISVYLWYLVIPVR